MKAGAAPLKVDWRQVTGSPRSWTVVCSRQAATVVENQQGYWCAEGR